MLHVWVWVAGWVWVCTHTFIWTTYSSNFSWFLPFIHSNIHTKRKQYGEYFLASNILHTAYNEIKKKRNENFSIRIPTDIFFISIFMVF